jgi:thymidylate kinase
MRIAISGSHRTGKSTLVSLLSELLPAYATIDEPYHSMEEEGHEFSHPPSIEDFEAQLARSIRDLEADGSNVLFDRSPIDFLAYAAAHEDADAFDLDEWLPQVRAAVETLDLIVFVPIESSDRITLSASDRRDETRGAVDEKLREMLIDDSRELELDVLEVEGDPETRVHAVMRRIRKPT